MHRALAIPELLLSVFFFLDGRSNANTAVVCKSWSEFALNELWKNVDISILKSLAPMDASLLEEKSVLVSGFTVRTRS